MLDRKELISKISQEIKEGLNYINDPEFINEHNEDSDEDFLDCFNYIFNDTITNIVILNNTVVKRREIVMKYYNELQNYIKILLNKTVKVLYASGETKGFDEEYIGEVKEVIVNHREITTDNLQIISDIAVSFIIKFKNDVPDVNFEITSILSPWCYSKTKIEDEILIFELELSENSINFRSEPEPEAKCYVLNW